MNNTATLTGWGQPDDALSSIAPNATHLPYLHFGNFNEASEHLAKQLDDTHTLVAWSLGGLLALHLCAKQMCSIKKLVLLGAPFQFVQPQAGGADGIGMEVETFNGFAQGFGKQPAAVADKFIKLIAHGDSNAPAIEAALNSNHRTEQNEHLGYWLGCLKEFDCTALDFSNMPQTIIIHGKNDVITAPAQAEKLSSNIVSSTLHMLDECGHAPHLHDADIIKTFL